MAVDGSTGGGMVVGPAEAMTVPSAAAVVDPTGSSTSQPSVNIDHLRRSGKIAIWPYIMRELPLSPVEALRLELRLKGLNGGRQRPGTATTATTVAPEKNSVIYYPACLASDDNNANGNANGNNSEREGGPHTRSDLEAPIGFTLGLDSKTRISSRSGMPSPSAWASQERAAGSDASLGRLVPGIMDTKIRRLQCDRRPASASGGARRRPRHLPSQTSSQASLLHCATGDHAECPSGCGEEIRLQDLQEHQKLFCASRYVDCLMPGCSTMVQARFLGVHLRRECVGRRKQRILAEKGKALDSDIACDACGDTLPRKHLRAHRVSGCPMRLVRCSKPGCTSVVTMVSLADHQKKDCVVAKRNAALAEKAKGKPTTEECPACHETVAVSLFRRHAADECSMRVVACPNRDLGCEEEFPAEETASHLRTECVVQNDRIEQASRYALRRQRVQCSGCGYMVVLQHLPRHQREKCPNRLVPCKHWKLGCPVMLRLSAMEDHTKVDRLLDPRSCLVFDSGKAYIALGEDDRKPPWTAEMWIWRPGLVEGTREKTRTALKALWEFQRARGKLEVTERRLALLEPLLLEVAARAARERSEEAEESRKKLTDEMIVAATMRDDAKVDLVVSIIVLSNSLTSATRGVEEITAHNRLHGFDRLSLGSTPWYAAAPNPHIRSAGGGDVAGRGSSRDGRELGGNPPVVLEQPPSSLAPPVSPGENQTVVPSTEIEGEENVSPDEALVDTSQEDNMQTVLRTNEAEGEEINSSSETGTLKGDNPTALRLNNIEEEDNSTEEEENNTKEEENVSPTASGNEATQRENVEEECTSTLSSTAHQQQQQQPQKTTPADKGNNVDVAVVASDPTITGSGSVSTGTGEVSVKGMLLNIAKEQKASAEVEEEAWRRKEAVFWAEWVALAGEALARRIVTLADETLPRLKEDTAAITGLSSGALFRTSGGVGTEEQGSVLDEGGGNIDDGASTASAKNKGKSRKAAKKAKRKKKHQENFGKNLETRIAEEVGKRGGVETLFGSANVLFQLEMGPNDRVGIKVAGKKDQIFNYRCPRERWVHLSFVSDSAGVLLLENGKTASRLGGVTVPLPMREIGGREMACQCLVQEVRYWSVKRSKEDLVAWMHEVLPGTAAADGLLGYWTFEEGAGEYVNDVTAQRFRTRKVGRGIKWANSELMVAVDVEAPPTPSWREKNVCKVELRLGRLAQRGRLHEQLFVSCPRGCGETFLQKDSRAHAAYRCAMRMVTCSMASCGKRLAAKDLPRHLEEYCVAHGAWVRMAEAGEEHRESCPCPNCGEIVSGCNLKVHLEYVCQWVKESCRNLGCAAYVPRIRREEHERRFCGASSAVRKRRRLARARARSKYRRQWAQDEE